MDDLTIARVVHVIGVILWIGGVAMVTTVLLPAARRRSEPAQGVAVFTAVEGGFARQARLTTLATGLSGFYMIERLDAWERYAVAGFWWLHAMTAVWAVFTLVLFVLEPLVLDRWFKARAAAAPAETMALVHRLHWVLLALSLGTAAAAVAGVHG